MRTRHGHGFPGSEIIVFDEDDFRDCQNLVSHLRRIPCMSVTLTKLNPGVRLMLNYVVTNEDLSPATLHTLRQHMQSRHGLDVARANNGIVVVKDQRYIDFDEFRSDILYISMMKDAVLEDVDRVLSRYRRPMAASASTAPMTIIASELMRIAKDIDRG